MLNPLHRCLITGSLLIISACGLPAVAAADDDTRSVAEFRLKNLDGKNVSLHESLASGPVLVSFWATWCKPCLQEMPHLNDLHAKHGKDGLSVFLISIDQPRSHNRVRSYIQSKKFDFEVLLDPNQDAFRKLRGQSVPYVVLLQPNGEPSYVKMGYRPGDEKKLAEAVELLFAEEEDASGGEGTESGGTN